MAQATVITTYVRKNNGSAVPMNSTTIYALKNETYPTPGLYNEIAGNTFPYAKIPGVPGDLLNDVYGALSYAGTQVDSETVVSFPHTDLVVTQPTPFDVWSRMGIVHRTPSISPSSGWSVWPARVCGAYQERYDFTSTTFTLTSDGTVTTSVSSSPTRTRSQLHPKDQDLYYVYYLSGMESLDATWIQTKTAQLSADSTRLQIPTDVVDWLGSQQHIVEKYPYVTNCFVAGDGQGQPTVHVPVNVLTATSSHIIDVHKASTTDPPADDPTNNFGEGSSEKRQPEDEPSTTAVAPTARIEISQTSLDVPKAPETEDKEPTSIVADPGSTGRTHVEDEEVAPVTKPGTAPPADEPTQRPDADETEQSEDGPRPTSTIQLTAQIERTRSSLDAPDAPNTENQHLAPSATRLGSTGRPLPKDEKSDPVTRPGTANREQGTGGDKDNSKPGGPDDKDEGHSNQQPSQDDDEDQRVDQDDPAQNTVRPTAGVEGLISAIQSIASLKGDSPGSGNGQQGSQVGPAAGASTGAPGDQPVESVTGFAIGTQTASPGGAAITREGSTYSALPSGSGLQVTAEGQTSTIVGVASPGLVVTQDTGSEDDYIVGDNTLAAGGSAITSGGSTFSALPAGSGVQVVANGQTSTLPVAVSESSITLQSGGSEEEYIVAGSTLTAGREAFTSAGTAYSALPSGSGIVVAVEGRTSTASVGEAIESESDTPTPVLLPAGSQQLVTIGGSTYTAHATEGSLLVVGGQTISPGATTVVNGESVYLIGSNLVQATGTNTSTHDLGDAIMSGIGGGEDETTSTTSTTEVVAEQTTSGAKRRAVFVSTGSMVAAVFALILI